MKVSPTQAIGHVDAPKPRAERAAAGAPPPQDRVTLSPAAEFVEAARDAAAQDPPFRADVVADVKAQLAAGTFEQSVDFDAALDGLLADL
jgi:flagellar biosynthesis anti-sigma factor FlgM